MVSRKLTPRKNLKHKYSPRRSQKKSLRSPKRTPPWHRKRKFDDEEEEEDIVYKLTTKKTAPVSSAAPPPPTKVEINEISITTEIQPLIIDVEDKIIESEIQTPKISIDEIALNCEIIQAARRPIVSDIDIDEVTISSEIKEPTVKIDEIFLTSEIKTPKIIQKPPVGTSSLRRNDGEPGLLINGTLVSSISGPVSMHILKPTKEFHESHKAPIFILFGDQHNSDENLCTECECSVDNKSCCYEIYSDKFLLLLDEVAKRNTVYFSTESGVAKNHQEHLSEATKLIKSIPQERKNILFKYPLRKLSVEQSACYSQSPETRNYCPTKHMIWHNADARQFENKYDIDAYMLDFYYLFNYANNLDNFNVQQTLDKLISKPEYLEILSKFLEPNFYQIKNQTGLSPYKKQINKMEEKDMNEWNIYVDTYYEKFSKYQYALSEKEKKYLLEIVEAIKEYKDDKEISKILNLIDKKRKDLNRKFFAISETILRFNLVSLDLYFLTRSFKTTSDGKNPLISIGYFGALHSKNIRDFLFNNMRNYEIVYNVDVDEEQQDTHLANRCLPINKFVNLDGMIEELTSEIVSKEVNLDEILITTQINPLSVKIDEIVLSTVINPVEVELTDITLTTEINTPKIDVNDIIVTSQINSPEVEIDEKTVTTLINPTQVEIEEVSIESLILPKILKAFDISLPIEASDIPLPETEEIDIDRVILRGEIKPSVVEVDPLTIASQINSPQVLVDDVTIASQINSPQVLVDDVTIASQINPPQVEVQEVLLTSSIQPLQNLVVDDVTITGQIIPIKIDINEVGLTSTIDIPQVEINDVAVTTQIIPPQVDIEEVVLTPSIQTTEVLVDDVTITSQIITPQLTKDDKGLRIDGKIYKSMWDVNHLSVLKSKDSNNPTILIMEKGIDVTKKNSVDRKKPCNPGLYINQLLQKLDEHHIYEMEHIKKYEKVKKKGVNFFDYLLEILLLLYYQGEFKHEKGQKKFESLMNRKQQEIIEKYNDKLNEYDKKVKGLLFPPDTDINDRYQKHIIDFFKIGQPQINQLFKFIYDFIRMNQSLLSTYDYQKMFEWLSHFVNHMIMIHILTKNFSNQKVTQICYIDNEKDREVITTFLTKTENLYELIMDENKGKDDVCMKFENFLDFDALDKETLGEEIKPGKEIKPEKKINSEEEKKKVKERELEVIKEILEFIKTTDNVSEVKNKFGDALTNKVRGHISNKTTKNEKEFTVEAGGVQYNLNLSSTALVGSRKAIIVKDALNPIKDGNIIWNWKCKDEAVKIRFKIYIKYVNRSEEFAHECIYDTGDVEKNSDSGILLRSEDYLDNEIYFIWDNSYSKSTSKTIIFTLSSSVTLNVVDYEPSPSVEWKVFKPSPHPLIKKN